VRAHAQEEEKLLKPNSAKAAIFMVMKARGGCPEGMTAQEVMEASKAEGIKTDWNDNALANIKRVSACGMKVLRACACSVCVGSHFGKAQGFPSSRDPLRDHELFVTNPRL